jgi:hypothetical protein
MNATTTPPLRALMIHEVRGTLRLPSYEEWPGPLLPDEAMDTLRDQPKLAIGTRRTAALLRAVTTASLESLQASGIGGFKGTQVPEDAHQLDRLGTHLLVECARLRNLGDAYSEHDADRISIAARLLELRVQDMNGWRHAERESDILSELASVFAPDQRRIVEKLLDALDEVDKIPYTDAA